MKMATIHTTVLTFWGLYRFPGRSLGWVLLAFFLLGFGGKAEAARTINSVTLNGASSVTVAPGASITAAIRVTTDALGGTNPTRWRSTGWLISTTAPGTVTCQNHGNFDTAGTNSTSFSVVAPTTPGTYNAYFIAYNNDTCNSGASATTVMANAVIVVVPLYINSATLNGASSVTVNTNQSITAVVTATTNASLASFQWRSTGWRIATSAPGAVTCVDHADYVVGGTFSETFTITAPSLSGVYNAYFIAYNDNTCGTGASATQTLAGGVNILSFIEFNATGGTTATNGLHFYIEDTTKIQAKRLNNTGQVYEPGSVPPSSNLDNGIFVRANGLVYGPSHGVGGGFTPSGGMYNAYGITAASPANPSSPGVQQTASGSFGITAGPQASILWKYTTPLDFITAEVSFTIPAGYPVSVANPVRYYHVFDTFLGGSDNGCGVSFLDAGKRVIGTYPPASGTTCPSNTAIPAGVSVVESFRERSGQIFTNYCASGWASFYDGSAPTCSVIQATSMSNTVSATYQDTGIGIQFDFTATGTYTFSYDFVVGSPSVPAYDHLEIRHDGVGTLCPENVTVLACISSEVPCLPLNIVNTGTLTGSVTTTPAVPAVTKTPATFSIGSSASTQSVALQSTVAGSVVLGTSGLSTVPLNGTKCWNTATNAQSCAMVFAATPCVAGYECLETGATYNNLTVPSSARNPLYMELTGTNFKFDVVALQSNGAVATTYTAANLTVELFDDSASPEPLCSAYASPIASQPLTFALADAGRKTLSSNFNLPNAYAKVRCRVTDTAVYGCSSDDFAVRPQQLTVTAPVLSNTALTGNPKAIAGSAFTLNAAAGVVAGYTGTPVLDVTKVQDHADANIAVGTLSGTFAAATGVAASGATFKYLDVGNLKLLADAVVDSGFTAVDQTTDCDAGSTSNVVSGGKYGCNIGSAASATLGRWVPSHYSFAGVLSPACTAGGQTYMDQAALGVALTLTAHASTGSPAAATDPVVSRYTAGGIPSYTNLAPVTITGDNSGVAVAVTRLSSPAFPVMSSTALWSAGLFQINNNYAFAKLSTPDGPYDLFKLKAALTDTDGGLLLLAANAETNTTKVRYGRVRLINAYGSDLLDLPMTMRSEYWVSGGWALNTADTCTDATLAFAAVGTPDITSRTCVWDTGTAPGNSGKACTTPIAVAARQYKETGVAGFAGDFNVWLKAPGATYRGSIDVTATVPLWLRYNWIGTVANPTARATFGSYKSPLIYRRENY
jgi:MSHA biogenesis protein MshQ